MYTLRRRKSSVLNGFITNDDLKGMIEGEYYPAVRYILQLFAYFTYLFLGGVESPELTTVLTNYTELIKFST